MSVEKKLAANTFYLFLNWFSISGLSFLYWFIAGKTLNPSEYGIIATSVNFMSILSAISLLGFTTALNKLIPEYLVKNQGKIKSLIIFSVKVVSIINASIVLLLIFFSPQLSQILKTNQEVIFITAIGTIFLSFCSLYQYILCGFQRMKKVFVSSLVGTIGKVAISLILIFLGLSYFGPLIGITIGFFITFTLSYTSFWLKIKGSQINQRQILSEFVLPAFVGSLAWMLFQNSQYVILTIIKNPSVTGIFALALILSSVIHIVTNTLVTALFPIISQLSARGTKRKQAYLINLVLRYSMFFTLPLGLLFILFSRQVILIFSSVEYLSAVQFFPILIPAAIIFGYGIIFLENLYAIGKTKIHRNIVILTALTFLFTSLPLTYLFSAWGLASAYLMAVILMTVLSILFMKKYLKLGLPVKMVGKILLACLLSFGFLFVLEPIFIDFFVRTLFAVISAFLYLFILLFLKFYTKEDVNIIRFFANRTPSAFKKVLYSLAEFLFRFV